MLNRVWIWLFSRPSRELGNLEVILWWELRRIPYNLIVGAFGLVSLALFFLFITTSGHLEAGEDAVEPMALFAAPFALNFFYTAGWMGEIVLRWIWGRNPRIGPILLKLGLTLSLSLAAIPSVLWGMVWLWNLITS